MISWPGCRPAGVRCGAYFLTGIFGVLTLTAAFAALPALSRWADWTDEQWLAGLACWNSGLVVWLATLIWLQPAESRDGIGRGFFRRLGAGDVGLACRRLGIWGWSTCTQ